MKAANSIVAERKRTKTSQMPKIVNLARQPIGEHDGVDRAGARSSDAFAKWKASSSSMPPGERAVTAATLQRVISVEGGLIVHTAHTAHATARHSRRPTVLLRLFGGSR
jgi:hypothetical protein